MSSNLENHKRKKLTNSTSSEIKIKARAVARGVAHGKIICLHGEKRQFYRINLDDSKIEREIRRFRASVRLAKRQINKIAAHKTEQNSKIQSEIFQTHLLLLSDNSLITKIEDVINLQKVNAEWAVKLVSDSYITTYKNIADENLREKYIDLEDIAERLQTALGGGRKTEIKTPENAVFAAKEIKPSTLIELSRNKPQAIITQNGGWTSHTFILARELNLPAVTGVEGILRRFENNDTVIVDGFQGQIIVHPEDLTLRKFKRAARIFQKKENFPPEKIQGELKTLDGREITMRANLDLTDDFLQAKDAGAKGIGLYRSEFLFNQNRGFPTEKEQVESYRKIAELVGEDGARIRTFDLNTEQIPDINGEPEKNPALGLRAIRLSFKNEKPFRTQIRALLRASFQTNLSIVLPMISDISEIHTTKEIIKQEKERLSKRRQRFGNPKIGAMIEIPAAVLIAEEICREVDFLCLGTNDLVQYLLAVDRDNESVADWFRTLHPAVLRAIKIVLRAAENQGISATICGEMAGSPVYAAVLIGLGANDLSMSPNSMRRNRRVISNIAYEEAHEIVKELETCQTAAEIEKKVREKFRKKWSHLFDKKDLP